jgi:tRNA threonylcarbamoyladenosine biosynthesis protein TsaE
MSAAASRPAFALRNEADTLLAGRLLAEALPEKSPYPAILLRGDLGAGKTSFVRGVAAALPGGEAAEVSSPSFNIVNYYPTQPELAHFDLYRLEHQPADEELLDSLDQENRLTVVEWVQYLQKRDWPEHRLEIVLSRSGGGRELAAGDADDTAFRERLLASWGRRFEKS